MTKIKWIKFWSFVSEKPEICLVLNLTESKGFEYLGDYLVCFLRPNGRIYWRHRMAKEIYDEPPSSP